MYKPQTGVNGERGLLIAILYQAAKDFEAGQVDDVQEFVQSDWYSDIMNHLGLHPSLRPEVMRSFAPAAGD